MFPSRPVTASLRPSFGSRDVISKATERCSVSSFSFSASYFKSIIANLKAHSTVSRPVNRCHRNFIFYPAVEQLQI